MESHANDSLAPSNSLLAGKTFPTGSCSFTAVCCTGSSCCLLTGMWSDLSHVAISPTTLANTSCCSLVCHSMALRSNLFSSHMASISSRMDDVSDSRLWVSSQLLSSSKCTVTIPCWIKWSNFSWDSEDVRNSCAKYSRPPGPRWRTISSASCAGIQLTSSMSFSDAIFKSNGGCYVAMIQHDIQQVICKNENMTKCAHEKMQNNKCKKICKCTVTSDIYTIPQNTITEPTAHWLFIAIALTADGLWTRRLNTPSHSWIDRKQHSSHVISIKNLNSFWILEWSIGKRNHDAWRMDNQLRSTASKKKKKITEMSFSWLMIGYWFLERIWTYRRQWRWNNCVNKVMLEVGEPPHLVDGLLRPWHVTWPDLIAWITQNWPF